MKRELIEKFVSREKIKTPVETKILIILYSRPSST